MLRFKGHQALRAIQQPLTGAARRAVPGVARAFSVAASLRSESFLQGNSSNYAEAMFEAWQQDPKSVHVSWDVYFRNVAAGKAPGAAFTLPPTLGSTNAPAAASSLPSHSASVPMSGDVRSNILDHMKVQLLVRAYQVRGHHIANLDPLGILEADLSNNVPPELEISYYGFTEKDLDRSFFLGNGMLPHLLSEEKQSMTLREIIIKLKEVYCSTIGADFMHIASKQQCDWIRARVETPHKFKFTTEQKRVILDRLIWSDSFERFVQSKYSSEKRFGLEGCEALIPGMKALIDRAVESGVENIVMGMPHRGRLNVLSNVVRKPNESIFSEFSGNMEPSMEGSGDVKYHLGMNYIRPTPSGKNVQLSLVANPSHLEAVNPVVEGKVRALQFYSNDNERGRTLPLLLHGDAAFAAQGVVYETLGFCDLPNYTTGGTIHIIVNNQIGFTTDPRFARSTPYCTDVAKSIEAPIFHVNGDDVESVVFVCQLAADWRRQFKKDVVIDIVCYRRHGHNEVDQPMFTQPRMYTTISKKATVLELYTKKLLAEGTFTQEEIESMKTGVWKKLEESYQRSKNYVPDSKEWLTAPWDGFPTPRELITKVFPACDTGVSREKLELVGKKSSSYPEGFNVHSGLARILKQRVKAIVDGEGIDWATAEAMAYGTLLVEGIHVRLSGQDVERGTFSHRHAVLNDQESEDRYIPLNNLTPDQAKFHVCNSSLSEFGTLGFELGYSLVSPRSLVLWEAQFGDFVNNAQCIIDQFIVSGEKKWFQRTGLVMLLPHGYDGAGPEHSSCRIERFLQMSDEHPYRVPNLDPKERRQIQDCNFQLVYCSTPANFFHAIRRQIYRDFRKPARSNLAEFEGSSQFRRVIPDESSSTLPDAQVKSLIFCTGQVYYALEKERQQRKRFDVAIARIEQLAPFPFDLVAAEIDRYDNVEQIVWCQEEPMNMGAWMHVRPRIETAFSITKNHQKSSINYAGREPSAAVATGNKIKHHQEEESLLESAFTGGERVRL